MPTAAKLVGALLFAALGYVASALAMPLLDGLLVAPATPVINAAIGLGVGWFVAGPRAGGGYVEGASNGVTATLLGLAAVLVVHGTIFATRVALRGRIDTPEAAIEAMVDFMLESAWRLLTLEQAALLGLGGAAIGLALEFVRARAD